MSATEIAPEKSRWTISHYALLSTAVIFVFCAIASILQRRLITGDPSDGFYSQIQGIAIALQTGTFDPIAEPLYAVHLVRFFIVYPWFMSWLNGMPPIIDALLVVPLLLTVVTIKFHKRHPVFNLLIFLLPLALSFRTVFVIVSIANLYAYFYSDSRSQWRLYLSGLLAFLSSGVTLAWLVVVAANNRQIIKHRFGLLIAIIVMAVSLAASIAQKIWFFTNRPPGSSESSGILSAVERNTIFVSYAGGNTARFLLYCGVLSLVVLFLYGLIKSGNKGRSLLLFFLTAAISFVFEGLGPIAFFMPVIWVITNNFVSKEFDQKIQTA